MRLNGKIALITGGAQGIGLATAKQFLSEGAKVAICDFDASALDAAASELNASGASLAAIKADVSKRQDCEATVKSILERFGRIDILINNAGITRDNLILRMSEEDWDAVLAVNLKAAFLFIKACAHTMLKQRFGRIVNIASVVGQYGNAGQVNYAASKGGIIALTKSIAKEFAPRNVLCNAVAPGFVRTRLTEKLPDEIKKQWLSVIPMGRFGEPEEIAKICLFLASEDITYLTGQVIGVNGGLYM